MPKTLRSSRRRSARLALAAPCGAAGSRQPPRKQPLSRLTPTSKTLNGHLSHPRDSFGNIVYVSGKGPGTGFHRASRSQPKNVLDQIESP